MKEDFVYCNRCNKAALKTDRYCQYCGEPMEIKSKNEKRSVIPVEVRLQNLKKLKAQTAELKRIKQLLIEISDIQRKIISVSGDERAVSALQGAIDFKTKDGIKYLTCTKDGANYLILVNTEDGSTIWFKVESIAGGINYERFHPEKMFEQTAKVLHT